MGTVSQNTKTEEITVMEDKQKQSWRKSKTDNSMKGKIK